jgi:transposase
MLKLAHWYREVEESDLRTSILSQTITVNYQSILNYFDNRSTNASAESFNAKIKAFRSQFRGSNINFSYLDYLIFCLTPNFERDPKNVLKSSFAKTPKPLCWS